MYPKHDKTDIRFVCVTIFPKRRGFPPLFAYICKRGGAGGRGILTWFAFESCVAVVSERTRTMGHSVGDPALGVGPARPLLQTRVPAHSVGAAFFVRLAVAVLAARIPGARDVRFTLEPVRARAHGPVIGHAALGIRSARRPPAGRVAGVLAFSVLTTPVVGTVGVRTAPDRAHPVLTYTALEYKNAMRFMYTVATIRANPIIRTACKSVRSEHPEPD